MKAFVVGWAFVAVLVGFSGILQNRALPMPALCGAITAGLVVVLAVRRDWRDRALGLGIRTLLAVHLLRFFGLYFIWLSRQGLIAADYALIAGWGPVIVAAGALVILLVFRPEQPGGSQAVLVWNVIGVFDVLLVFGVMARMARPDPLLQGGFATLPLSLLPTLILPLIIVSHLLIFVWRFRWRPQRRS